jgi:hypothetical protein
MIGNLSKTPPIWWWQRVCHREEQGDFAGLGMMARILKDAPAFLIAARLIVASGNWLGMATPAMWRKSTTAIERRERGYGWIGW